MDGKVKHQNASKKGEQSNNVQLIRCEIKLLLPMVIYLHGFHFVCAVFIGFLS